MNPKIRRVAEHNAKEEIKSNAVDIMIVEIINKS